MANAKITDLTAATTPLAGTELFETVQSSFSRKVAASDIAATATNVRTVATGGTGAATLTGYVKGNGTSAMTASATIPFADIAGRAYCIAYNTADVTFTADTPQVVEFDTAGLEEGITVENDGGGNPTRITFAAAGTYEIAVHCQFANADNSNHVGNVWFRLNGTDIPYSASKISVPKATDGGTTFFQVQGILQVTAAQYVEVVCAVSNVNVTLDYEAAQTSPYNHPSIASALIVAQRIA